MPRIDHLPPASFARKIRKQLTRFQDIETHVTTLTKAKQGGPTTMAMAGLGFGLKILDKLKPVPPLRDQIRDAGFKHHPSVLRDLLFDTLIENDLPVYVYDKHGYIGGTIPASDMLMAETFFVVVGDAIGFFITSGRPIAGPYTKDVKVLTQTVDKFLWKGSPCLGLSIRRSESDWRQVTYTTHELQPPGPLLGSPTPEEIVRQTNIRTSPKTLLFIGPTGSGKSTSAHHVAASAHGATSKVLKLDRKSISAANGKDIIAAIQFLKPNVILIDDVQWELKYLLESLENIRGITIILTYMEDKPFDPAKPGSLYFAGLRPGRVDHIFYIGLPDAEKREQILRNYVHTFRPDFTDFVGATKNLPTAYLKTAAEIYNGNPVWQDPMRHLFACAPNMALPS